MCIRDSPSIVAAGANGASPHAIPGQTVLEAGQCVVLDFGARAHGYCSDMTLSLIHILCGTGPTALSILHACAIAGADVAMLVGRDKERSRKVLEGYVEMCIRDRLRTSCIGRCAGCWAIM